MVERARALIERVFREQWGRVLASLIGFLGDFDLAEDAAQEAFAIAAERWPREGATATTRRLADYDGPQPRDRPDPPRAHPGRKTRLLDVPEAEEDHARPDRSATSASSCIFTCCHPALATEAQVALTLRALGGLDTERDRARVPRPGGDEAPPRPARSKDPAAGIPFSVPPEHLLTERLAAVLAIVYLIFNEGYGGRVDLAAEAIRLGLALAELMPDEAEVQGLLALMLLHDSRRGRALPRR